MITWTYIVVLLEVCFNTLRPPVSPYDPFMGVSLIDGSNVERCLVSDVIVG